MTRAFSFTPGVTAKLLLALSLGSVFSVGSSGCIAFVERGTRGGKISPMASSGVLRGDKRMDVINKLGEPDETSVSANPDGSGTVENMTFKAVEGYYVIVFGRMEFSTLKVSLVNGAVESVSAFPSGRDTLVLTGYSAGSFEPMR